jgi:hypothetical protein
LCICTQNVDRGKLSWTWQSPCAVPAGRCCHRPLLALARIRQPRGTSAWRWAKGPGSSQPAVHRYRTGPRQHQPRARPNPASAYWGCTVSSRDQQAPRAAAKPFPAMPRTSGVNREWKSRGSQLQQVQKQQQRTRHEDDKEPQVHRYVSYRFRVCRHG